MSAAVQTAQNGSGSIPAGKPFTPVAASVVGAILAVSVVAGLFAIASTSVGTWGCMPRVGCEQRIESGVGAAEAWFAAAGAEGASAIWFSMAVEPASPVLEHFLHQTSSAAGRADFGPVSPALEHFLHPAPDVA